MRNVMMGVLLLFGSLAALAADDPPAPTAAQTGNESGSVEDEMATRLSKVPARESADWVHDAVIYECFPRVFSAGGTFKEVEAKLDELSELGVTVLWFVPVHPIGVKNRKGSLGCPYSVKDYYKINPEWGTLADFKRIVKQAHARDMKVIIDLVANHTAWDNPLIKEHPEWYVHNDAGEIVAPVPDWSDVADLNYDQPALRTWMREMMLHWVRDIGIDGFRCDVAGMVPLDFWESVRPQLDAIKPVIMLAEDDQPAQHVKAFDMTYDFAMYDALDGFKQGKVTPETIEGVIKSERLRFPQGSLRMRFTSNHDKNPYVEPAISRYGVRGAKALAVMTYALPGAPLIYNGQEAANDRKLGLFDKCEIDWTADDHGLRALYTDLSRVRRERASLRRGSLRFVRAYDDQGVLGLVREHEGEKTYVLINLGKRPAEIELGDGIPKSAADVFGNAKRTGATVKLPAYGVWMGG